MKTISTIYVPLYARQVIIQQTIHIKNNGVLDMVFFTSMLLCRFDLTRTASYDIEYQGYYSRSMTKYFSLIIFGNPLYSRLEMTPNLVLIPGQLEF